MKFDPKNAPPVTKEQVTGIIDQLGKSYPPEYAAVLKGIVQQESGFKNIQGRANSQDHGVFQINEVNLKKGNLNPYDPVEAAKFAFDLLDKNVRSTGSLEAGIAAYNAGAGRINSFLKGAGKPLHDITKKYAAEVMAKANTFQPGIFSLDRINETAQKFGYGGKADFVAMAGGKKNLSNAPMVSVAPPAADTMAASLAGINAAQPAPQTEQAAQLASDKMATPAAPLSMESAVASLQPEMPTYKPEQENQLASAFGFEPEAQSNSFGLPDGLMNDIRRAVAAA